MFFWGVDTMLTKSWIIYQDLFQAFPLSQKEFRLQFAWELILAGPSPMQFTTRSASIKAKMTLSEAHTPQPEARTIGIHIPCHVEGNRETCWMCKLRAGGEGETKNTPRTRYYCNQCKKSLCLNESRNCIEEYHEL